MISRERPALFDETGTVHGYFRLLRSNDAWELIYDWPDTWWRWIGIMMLATAFVVDGKMARYCIGCYALVQAWRRVRA